MGLFFYNKIGSIISIGDLPTTNIIEPITVNGGTIKMTGQSGFDFDGTAIYTCGEIYLNGEKQTEIVNSMPGGGGPNGGPQGGGPAPGGQG